MKVIRQKQMGVSLPSDLRAKLEAAADVSGTSIAEEIRRRLWLSFVDGHDPARREHAAEIFRTNEYWLNQ